MGKQRSGSIPCCGLRKTMHDNLAGNKVVKKNLRGKKQKGVFYKWINDLEKKRQKGGFNPDAWVRKNLTKKQQRDADRWAVKKL